MASGEALGLFPGPGDPAALTVDKFLLLGGDNAAQVRLLLPTAALGIHPALAVREVAVTVALELGPALLAQLLVCNTGQGLEGRGRGRSGWPWWLPIVSLPSVSHPQRRGEAQLDGGSGWQPGRPGPGPLGLLGMLPPSGKCQRPFLALMPVPHPQSFSPVEACSAEGVEFSGPDKKVGRWEVLRLRGAPRELRGGMWRWQQQAGLRAQSRAWGGDRGAAMSASGPEQTQNSVCPARPSPAENTACLLEARAAPLPAPVHDPEALAFHFLSWWQLRTGEEPAPHTRSWVQEKEQSRGTDRGRGVLKPDWTGLGEPL